MIRAFRYPQRFSLRSVVFLAVAWLCFALCATLGASTAQAWEVDTPLPDAAQEARAQALFAQLRCVVCEGQALSDSHASLAQDMRRLVREKIHAGESDDAILRFLVERYGEHILLTPPLSAGTILLWFSPLFILVLAGWYGWRHYERFWRTEA